MAIKCLFMFRGIKLDQLTETEIIYKNIFPISSVIFSIDLVMVAYVGKKTN